MATAVNPPRIAAVERNSKETQISATVNLDGVGATQIDCPIGFFGHMLDRIDPYRQTA